MLIAHESKKTLRDAIMKVNSGKFDAIVQVGIKLAMAEVVALAAFWLAEFFCGTCRTGATRSA